MHGQHKNQINTKGQKMKKIVEQNWDYTKHAKYYSYRPNYAPESIDMLINLIAKNKGGGAK